MNGPGYPLSHQSGASQLFPANSPAFTSTSLTSAPAYGAVTNWDSNACSIYASRNILDLTVAFGLERAIETDQPPMPLSPRKVQVAIILPYPSDDRRPRGITVPTEIPKILHISERDVPGVAKRSRSELSENVREPTLSVQPERWEAEVTFPQGRTGQGGNWMRHRDCTFATAHVFDLTHRRQARTSPTFCPNTKHDSDTEDEDFLLLAGYAGIHGGKSLLTMRQ
ncbi:uncharacterized protein BT62DRAFT_922950 [Guyanagaster necrorhizus]|uniref:Uncharacterized protein n=1 Tax=Guyanagaster necrorhizus TaxID=856835 RepID=A0A9P8ANH6_9AGAR|nr:uncharacterized protein BT62DRAFT_922950 [Guyanagaster necrorhizus MCA 3950]KAG7441920.1 hypothetical protein BT62DRAFT_922950 [Guyanagaster necrorhizus MCA 3950]